MKRLTVTALAVAALLSGSAFAHEAGEFFIRVGSTTVHPTEGAGGTSGSLGGFSVTNNIQLDLMPTCVATDNIGVKLLVAAPPRHKTGIRATDDIATIHHLPPTPMVQWYLGDASSRFRPYIDAGINYTTFFGNGFNDHGKEAGLSDLNLRDSWGAAGQVGVDYLINRDWLINMSVWCMDIDTITSYKPGDAQQHNNVRLDPWVFMFPAGYHFQFHTKITP